MTDFNGSDGKLAHYRVFPQWTCAYDHARLWLYGAGRQTTMKNCPSCNQELPDISRFCTQCGHPVDAPASASPPASTPRVKREDLNINVLYAMVVALVLALLFPPWETPASQEPEFLGLHFILSPPEPEAVVSRILLTIELTTVAIAGLYGSFLLRSKN